MKKYLFICILLLLSGPSFGQVITPIVSSTLESGKIICSGPCSVRSFYVTATAVTGYILTFNSTTIPADGAVTPRHCVAIQNGNTISLNYDNGPPDYYSTGFVVAFSTTGCFIKTASATAYFNARVQ